MEATGSSRSTLLRKRFRRSPRLAMALVNLDIANGQSLYVTNSKSGTVSKVDAATARCASLLPLATRPVDGDLQRRTGLYIVNYQSSTVSKLRPPTSVNSPGWPPTAPIGIAYEPTTVRSGCQRRGSIMVFQDRKPPAL